MRNAKEEPTGSAGHAIDLISAVKSVNKLSSDELSKLLKDSENLTIHFTNEKGLPDKIDMEKLAGLLPTHLIALLISSNKDESLYTYVLCGIRLLHSLCDLAPRHSKIEQILLDDVKITEQLLDLVFYLLIVLNANRKNIHDSGRMPFLHSTLVACSLYLLTACISSQWQELAQVLVVHPQVDIFMEAAFDAVHMIVRFLHNNMYAQHAEFSKNSVQDAEAVASFLCQQLEASLQCLQYLCQQKGFRERMIKNQELCGKGGVLFLAQSILKLNASPRFLECTTVLASISRQKAKILAILLHLCEAESVSYLDAVASSPESLNLAKFVASEIFEIWKTRLCKDSKHLSASSERAYPMGLLQLSAMRLADVFSDDSNFRSYVTLSFTEFLSAIFSLSHGDFLSMWCSSDLPEKEEDATLEYDSFAAAGWVLDSFSAADMLNFTKSEFSFISSNMSQGSYVHQRTSLFIKVVANLHCFIPDICEAQEKHFFLRKFLECLQLDPSKSLPGPGFSFASGPQKHEAVWRNICSLVCHAESLTPTFLNAEDNNLIRMFSEEFRLLINPGEIEETQDQEAQSLSGCPSSLPRREPPNLKSQNGNLKEGMSENYAVQGEEHVLVRSKHIDQGDDEMEQDMMEDKDEYGKPVGSRDIDREVVNIETSGSDTDNGDSHQLNKQIKDLVLGGDREDEKADTAASEEQQRRKRKRTVMNDKQVRMMERALLDEPDMQRNTASVQSWADKLSCHGTEVTSSQLRNWLNNRKARLSRASKEALAILEAEIIGNQGGPTQGNPPHDTLDSPGKEAATSSTSRDLRDVSGIDASESPYAFTEPVDDSAAGLVQWKQDQVVRVVDEHGTEIGTARIHQVQGKWCGMSLDESGKCVVDIVGLKVDRWMKVPYPSEASGASFEEAEKIFGGIRVMWDSNKLFLLRPQ